MSNTSDCDSQAKSTEIRCPKRVSPSWARRLRYYGLALLFVATAGLLRWMLPGVLGPTPFLAFYLAWVGAAAFGGLGPGLFATVASWLCVESFFDFTPGQFLIGSPTEPARLVILLVGGVTVSLIAERMRRGRVRERGQMHELAELTRALRESEDRLHLALEAARMGAWQWEVGTQHVEWSAELYALLGYEPGRVTPTHEAFRRRVHPQDLARWEQAVRESIERREDYFCEFRIVWADGSVHWVEARGRYADGDRSATENVWMRGVLSDIEQRKHAEEALQEALTQAEEGRSILEAMMEHIPLGIMIADAPDTKVRMTSRYGRAMFEPTREEPADIPAAQPRPIVGVYRADSMTPAAREELPLVRATQHGEWIKEEEWVVIRNDGVKIPILCTAAPIYDQEGRVTGGVLGWQDMTQRKQVEAQLQRLNEELEQRVRQRTAELWQRTRQLQKLTLDISEAEDRERRRMAEILHDDLQQVLAAAKFHLSLLRRQAPQDSALQALAGAIDQMLKDAIAKSRSLSHELSPAVLQHGDLDEILRWLAQQIQAKHGLVVHVYAHDGVHVQSSAVTALLYKSAQELLFNVVKHARVTEASVRVRQSGRYVCLSVSDRGRGFDPQELRGAAGSGVLSIRERVELLGGHMKIKSVKGKGSTFFIAVPEGQESQGAVGVGPRAYPTSGGHGGPPLRVLLADDHQVVRQGLAALLGEEETIAIVGEATNGRQAVKLADQLRPDVVIMDVSMPVMNGAEATRRIKEDLPRTRIISLSMFEEFEARKRMYEAGAESYVLKTASADELLAAIHGESQTHSAVPRGSTV